MWIICMFTTQRCTPRSPPTSPISVTTTQNALYMYQPDNCHMMVLRSSTIAFHFHLFMSPITTSFISIPKMCPALQKPKANMCKSIQSTLQFGFRLMVPYTWSTVKQASQFATSISIGALTKYIYGKQCLVRRSIGYHTGVSSTSWAELLTTCFSGTLWCQLSVISPCPTRYIGGWTKCPVHWSSSRGNQAECVIIVRPIHTSFAMMFTLVYSTTILLNALSSSCNNMGSGNICCILPQQNSIKLRNISTQRRIEVAWSGMNRYVSWILS